MKHTFYPLFIVLPVLISYTAGVDVFGGDPTIKHQHASITPGNTPHPPGLPSIWKGRDVSELVASLGEPDIVLETAARGYVIYGDTHSVMYVYAPKPGSVSRYYEAYVVEHDTGEVLAHHHR